MVQRRYSHYLGRRLRLDEDLAERFVLSRVGYRYVLHLAPRIDRWLIPLSRGRLGSLGRNRVAMVTTRGARSGEPRRTPLVVVPEDGTLLATGSNYGRPQHPGWSANLIAHPDCTVEFQGPPAPYRAELLAGADRDAAWATITDLYAGYRRYAETCAPRVIRIFRLVPEA